MSPRKDGPQHAGNVRNWSGGLGTKYTPESTIRAILCPPQRPKKSPSRCSKQLSAVAGPSSTTISSCRSSRTMQPLIGPVGRFWPKPITSTVETMLFPGTAQAITRSNTEHTPGATMNVPSSEPTPSPMCRFLGSRSYLARSHYPMGCLRNLERAGHTWL